MHSEKDGNITAIGQKTFSIVPQIPMPSARHNPIEMNLPLNPAKKCASTQPEAGPLPARVISRAIKCDARIAGTL